MNSYTYITHINSLRLASFSDVMRIKQIEKAKSPKQIKKLVKDLKDAVKCVEKSDKGLADILEEFIADAVINMKLTKEQALEWEKWFYEEK